MCIEMNAYVLRNITVLGFLLCMPFAYAQNVGLGTVSPQSKLHIKGSENISQLTIDAATNQGNQNPLVRLRKNNGSDVMWLHSDDTTNVFLGLHVGRENLAAFGKWNTFIGSHSAYFNQNGNANTVVGYGALHENINGYNNTAVGYKALYENSGNGNTGVGAMALEDGYGNNNTAIGYHAMRSSFAGVGNTAIGNSTLVTNSANHNTAVGSDALHRNVSGHTNTALGASASHWNSGGNFNVALGNEALFDNVGGAEHTAVGYQALYNTDGSWGNTALGYKAGMLYDPQYQMTFIGHASDANANGYANSTALGANSLISANNQVRIGWASTSIGGPQNWTNTSDARIKQNIRTDVPGLSFINLLEPVTYTKDLSLEQSILGSNEQPPLTPDNAYEQIRYSGFLAQDVESAAQSVGYDFSGVDAPKNDKDLYGLRYAEFVVPLVKAVQELSVQNEELKTQNQKLETLVLDLATRLNALEAEQKSIHR